MYNNHQGSHISHISKYPTISQHFRSLYPTVSEHFRSPYPTISQHFRSPYPTISQHFSSPFPNHLSTKATCFPPLFRSKIHNFSIFFELFHWSVRPPPKRQFFDGFPTTWYILKQFLNYSWSKSNSRIFPEYPMGGVRTLNNSTALVNIT